MVGYAAYSLLNQQHRGWYSWVLNSLVGFVYMFGFVMMTPQLFINYKVGWRFDSCFVEVVRARSCERRFAVYVCGMMWGTVCMPHSALKN